jgi:hypothetical protein
MRIPFISGLVSSWHSVYEPNGGLPAVRRCMNGTIAVLSGRIAKPAERIDTEVVTFSVVPKLTAAWSLFMNGALGGSSHRVLVGDCSGGLEANAFIRSEVYPIYNFLHGRKLDYFIKRVAISDYVIISDDDIMWLSAAPYNYARKVFEENPDCAVVSLKPRQELSSLLKDHVDEAMGSFCLVIRRDVWLKEGLSFKMQKAPKDKQYEWFYDTADFANIELVKRGYSVHIAPEEIRQELVAIEGASTWLLKVQKHKGEIEPLIKGIPVRQQKAYDVLLFTEALGALLARHFADDTFRHFARKRYLDRAKNVCQNLLDSAEKERIRYDVNQKILKLEKRLVEILVQESLQESQKK